MDGQGAVATGTGGDAGGAGAAQGGIENFEQLVGGDPGFADQGDAAPDTGGTELDAAAGDAEAEANAVGDDGVDEDAQVDTDESGEPEPIHGLKPDDILSAIREGRIPDELLDKLTITQRIDGQDVPVTLAQARENGMRLSDYSRKNNELRGREQTHKAAVDDFVSMVQSWKVNTPEARGNTRTMLERWIGDETLLDIARDIADEQVRLDAMGADGKAAFMRSRKLERELQAERHRAQQLEQRSRGREQTEGRDALTKRVNTLRDSVFAKHKIHMSAATDQIFKANLRGLWDHTSEITQELADQAAQATLEDLARLRDEHANAETVAGKAQAQRTRLPAKPAPRGGGVPGQPRGKMKRGGIQDIEKLMGM